VSYILDMFVSERVRLRATVAEDAAGLFDLWSDPETHLLSDDSPLLPKSVESVRAKIEKDAATTDEKFAGFVAEAVADSTLIGSCCLWGIDAFNQLAHIGISLLPAARGQGYGPEMVRLLCRYGFRNRNMRRLEIETLASNVAMRKAAEACGFIHEGIQREREYDGDGFADMAIYGLLRSEWKP
jgi:RimJ/RimL family protein N-acetyltransferase